jgi:hypothetical protein
MRPEHWLYTIPLRLRSLFRWAQADQELDDELRDHLQLLLNICERFMSPNAPAIHGIRR